MSFAPESVRARSFDGWAREYDAYRPGYPDALFDRIAAKLALPERPTVVDLGAGTGRATLAMAERGWRVTAVDPGKPMLDVLRARATEAGLVVATLRAHAEETGIDAGSVDLVTAAQAFHWFDRQRVLTEFARIVRLGGGVALFWNMRDETRSELVAAYHDLLDRRFGGIDSGRDLTAGGASARASTGAALEGSNAFDAVELEELSHEVVMTADGFVGMVFTASYVRTQEPIAQAAFRAELEELLARHVPAGTRFSVPYRVDLWTARRRDR